MMMMVVGVSTTNEEHEDVANNKSFGFE